MGNYCDQCEPVVEGCKRERFRAELSNREKLNISRNNQTSNVHDIKNTENINDKYDKLRLEQAGQNGGQSYGPETKQKQKNRINGSSQKYQDQANGYQNNASQYIRIQKGNGDQNITDSRENQKMQRQRLEQKHLVLNRKVNVASGKAAQKETDNHKSTKYQERNQNRAMSISNSRNQQHKELHNNSRNNNSRRINDSRQNNNSHHQYNDSRKQHIDKENSPSYKMSQHDFKDIQLHIQSTKKDRNSGSSYQRQHRRGNPSSYSGFEASVDYIKSQSPSQINFHETSSHWVNNNTCDHQPRKGAPYPKRDGSGSQYGNLNGHERRRVTESLQRISAPLSSKNASHNGKEYIFPQIKNNRKGIDNTSLESLEVVNQYFNASSPAARLKDVDVRESHIDVDTSQLKQFKMSLSNGARLQGFLSSTSKGKENGKSKGPGKQLAGKRSQITHKATFTFGNQATMNTYFQHGSINSTKPITIEMQNPSKAVFKGYIGQKTDQSTTHLQSYSIRVGKIILADGSSYEGQWHNNLPHGQGRRICSDGSSYKGNYYQGIQNGYGVLITVHANGDRAKYQGDFVEGKFHGTGELQTVAGDLYKGTFVDGRLHGQGEVIYCHTGANASGEVKYVGEFKNGKRHGFGKYFYADGREWHGQWEDHKQNGKGALYTRDGSVALEGYWIDGIKTDQD